MPGTHKFQGPLLPVCLFILQGPALGEMREVMKLMIERKEEVKSKDGMPRNCIELVALQANNKLMSMLVTWFGMNAFWGIFSLSRFTHDLK